MENHSTAVNRVMGGGIFFFRDAQLQIHQFGDLAADGINMLIERAIKFPGQPFQAAGFAREKFSEVFDGGIRRGIKLFGFLRQLAFLRRERGGHVGFPVLVNPRVGLIETLQGFLGGKNARVSLVGGINDEHGIIIRNGFELFERDNTVVVDRFETGVGFADAHDANDADGDGNGNQNGADEVEFGAEFQLFHNG
jgi:hypothetical protein